MPSGVRPAWPVGVARVAVSGLTQGHKWVNVFYLNCAHTNPVTVNDLSTVATSVSTAHPVTSSTYISSSTSLTQVQLDFIPSLGNTLSFTGSFSVTGTGGTAVADAGSCYVIDWVISSRYRGGHPRMYVPGLCAADVTNGSIISSSKMTAAVAGATTLKNTLNALTTTNITAITIGTVHYQRGNAWLSPPTFDAFTSAKAGNNSLVGSQRRRIKS